ncbi:MAG: MFS transporter [Anaerolineae bacterium]|nr:MFS transporter [Anaerolineae bacterium]
MPGLRGALYYGFYWAAIAAFDPFLNVYLNQLGFTGLQIGWISMLIPLFIMLIPPWLSRIADKYAIRVRLLTAHLLAVCVTLMLFTIPRTFEAFLPIAILVAVLRSSVGPLADSLVARMASNYRIEYGNMRFWGSLTFFAFSLGLGYVWSLVGFNWMFIVAGLLMLLVAVSALLLDETPLDPALKITTQPVKNQNGYKLFLQDKGLVLLTLSSFLVIGAMSMAGNFIGIYMVSMGGNETYVGAIWGFSALFEIPLMIYASRIARRLGYTTTLLLSYLFCITAYFGYVFSFHPMLLILFMSIKGCGFGLLFVNAITIIDRCAPPGLNTTFQGISSSLVWGLSPLLAGPLSGLLYESYGPITLFITCGIICIAGGILLLPTYSLWKNVQA